MRTVKKLEILYLAMILALAISAAHQLRGRFRYFLLCATRQTPYHFSATGRAVCMSMQEITLAITTVAQMIIEIYALNFVFYNGRFLQYMEGKVRSA